MVETLPNALSFEGVVTEHHELMKNLGALRNWWSELAEIGSPRFGERGNRVKELRTILAAHFEIEEAGGYLSTALAAAPHLAPRADRIAGPAPSISRPDRQFVYSVVPTRISASGMAGRAR